MQARIDGTVLINADVAWMSLFHRPIVLISQESKPAAANVVAAPTLKLCVL